MWYITHLENSPALIQITARHISMANLPAVRQRLSHFREINSQSILDQLTITFLIVRMDCIPCTYFMQRNAV